MAVTASFFYSCTGLGDALTNIKRLQFKLGRVTGMKVAGVHISDKNSIKDFNVLEGAGLLSAFTSGKLNANFTLNVLAKNPNDGTGGSPKTSAVIKGLAWRLLIDDKEFINGNFTKGIDVPGIGQETNIPIEMSFDLLSFLKGEKFDNLMNLAFTMGGRSGNSSKLKLVVKPTVDTFLGPITYPGEITVIDKEFRSQ